MPLVNLLRGQRLGLCWLRFRPPLAQPVVVPDESSSCKPLLLLPMPTTASLMYVMTYFVFLFALFLLPTSQVPLNSQASMHTLRRAKGLRALCICEIVSPLIVCHLCFSNIMCTSYLLFGEPFSLVASISSLFL